MILSNLYPFNSLCLVAEQIPQANASTNIHSKFPYWFRNEVSMVLLINETFVIKLDVTLHWHIFVGL